MLSEYGILLEVFGREGTSDSALRFRMNALKGAFFDEGGCLVRDPNRLWRQTLENMLADDLLSLAAKEVAKKLCKRCLRPLPQPDDEWSLEGREQWIDLFNASFDVEEFDALLVRGGLQREVRMKVTDLDSESGRPLPSSRSTVRLPRSVRAYTRVLHRVFAVSRELVFIDPYLDFRDNYKDFPSLLNAIPPREEPPYLKLHRQAKPNHSKSAFCKHDWEEHFRPLGEMLKQQGVRAEVFIWGKFHDRHLLHSHGGISLSRGFDTSSAPDNDEPTTWSRMSLDDCESIRKEFSENSPHHELVNRFEIGID